MCVFVCVCAPHSTGGVGVAPLGEVGNERLLQVLAVFRKGILQHEEKKEGGEGEEERERRRKQKGRSHGRC